MALPTKQTLEGAQLSNLKWLLYGPPGIGKSTFFSKATDGKRAPLFLYTDPGLRFLKAYKKPIMAWREFSQIVKNDIIKANPRIYSMIVIDTADLLFRMCRRELCLKRNIEHISDEQWGKGYDLVRDDFEQTIAMLANWCDTHETGLAFISHMKDVEIRGRTVKTNKLVPTLPKQAYDIIMPLCDIIGYAGFEQGKADRSKDAEMGRVVIFEPDETVEAKDRTGLLPAKCALDYDVVKQALEGDSTETEESEEEVEE